MPYPHQTIAPDFHEGPEQGNRGGVEHVPGQQIRSRCKVKCRFGPNRSSVPQTTTPFVDSLPPSIVAPQDPAQASSVHQRSEWSKFANLMPSSSELQENPSEDEEAGPSNTAPCRVTLRPPGIRNRSPYAGHYGIPPEPPDPPQPNPNRFAYQRMGLSQETLDARVTAEVNEFLWEARAERQLVNIFLPDVQRILSKEDCLTLFRATGVPHHEDALFGVWRWAADLDIARFNFKHEVINDDYSFLNAYYD